MNNKAHLRPKDFDNNGDIIPMSMKEEKGDLVSRSYLKNLPFERVIHTDFGETAIPIEEIDNAPAVDIKDQIAGAYNEGYMCGNKEAEKTRPQGKWKVFGRQGGIPVTDYCSNCKYEMMWYRNKYNYCPNCGAKMKGGAE